MAENKYSDIVNNGWNKWAVYVIKELERLGDGQEDLNKDIGQIRTDIAQIRTNLETLKTELRIKSGIWGAIGGSIPVAIAIGVWIIQYLVG